MLHPELFGLSVGAKPFAYIGGDFLYNDKGYYVRIPLFFSAKVKPVNHIKRRGKTKRDLNNKALKNTLHKIVNTNSII